jgi:hypothetical protein
MVTGAAFSPHYLNAGFGAPKREHEQINAQNKAQLPDV